METVTLYREIGKALHSLGAFRVVLLSSKVNPEPNALMSLEIAVDGTIDLKEAEKECANRFENVVIKFIDLNDYENHLVMKEVIEDGIIL